MTQEFSLGCHLRKTPVIASIDIKFPVPSKSGAAILLKMVCQEENNNEYKWSISSCWCPEFHLTTTRQVSNSTS